MSTATTRLSNSNQLYTEYSYAKVFIGDNYFSNETFKEESSAEVTLPAGTILARITAAGADLGKVVPLDSAGTTGRDLPIGVLGKTITIPADAEVTVPNCYSGMIAQEKLGFQGSDTLNTVVNGRTYGDRLRDLGLNYVPGTELTEPDNF